MIRNLTELARTSVWISKRNASKRHYTSLQRPPDALLPSSVPKQALLLGLFNTSGPVAHTTLTISL